MRTKLRERVQPNRSSSAVALEILENRRLCYASIPSGDTALETVQIRPAAATYTSELTLTAGQTYFFRATGYTRTSSNKYDGDAAFEATTTTSTTTTTTTASSWGITVNVGSTAYPSSGWGTAQGDNVYGQYIKPTTGGAVSFTFANDGTDKISTLAVTVYAAVPAIDVSTIRTDNVTGSVAVSSLPAGAAFIPLNNADFDHNGVVDDQQKGAVVGDRFLLPITLPAIAGDAATAHLKIEAPHGLRVWLNPDRTGSAAGVGLRVTKARTVYLEAYAEQPQDAVADLKVFFPYDGVTVEQEVPVHVFSLGGPTTATAGTKDVYTSDSTIGKWLAADGGTLGATATVKQVSYANVIWGDTTETGYVDFEADDDYIWGWGVEVE